MNEYRASTALPIDGKPSWYGQYRPTPTAPWRTACSAYGAIRYATPEYALQGAKAYAEIREARENGEAVRSLLPAGVCFEHAEV